ncbi:hypothetical protein ACJ73_06196 [Blastomyces percursus]|uniref:Uncharacterized protein n=1 Tax=Blastomyces percursus TaxID=1658174 RepID=A0A1J9QQH8_9EURO|nr:hypothetical protein ACJ73_06196 [Blastomyces percursus]
MDPKHSWMDQDLLVLVIACTVSYSYAGLNNVNTVLSEVENPIRTLKVVDPAALVSTDIKRSGELTAALFFERVFGSGFGRTALSLAIAISAAGNIMVVAFTAAHLNQEIARQGFLPLSHLLSTFRPFNTPLGGFIVHYIQSLLAIILALSDNVYSFILDIEGYPIQIITLALSVGPLILRYKAPDLPRPFKAWTSAVWISIALSIGLLAAPFFPPKDGKGDVNFFYATYAIVGVGMPSSLIDPRCGLLVLRAVLIPRWKGYVLEEKTGILEDGVSVTKVVRLKI